MDLTQNTTFNWNSFMKFILNLSEFEYIKTDTLMDKIYTRKPHTCRKSPIHFITWCIEYSNTPRHEWDSNSQLRWLYALTAQVIVNWTTIRSRPCAIQSLPMQIFHYIQSSLEPKGNQVWTIHRYIELETRHRPKTTKQTFNTTQKTRF
jgi:hypothetical protein